MKECEILFTGAVGAGKTTAIGCIGEALPAMTDALNVDTSVATACTTVGLDFAELTLDTGNRLCLFGAPGRSRFDFLWKLLVRRARGVVILLDNSRPDPLADLHMYLDVFSYDLPILPCVVGVGRTDTHVAPSLDAYAGEIARKGWAFPVFGVDVRRKDDVMLLIGALVARIEADTRGSARIPCRTPS